MRLPAGLLLICLAALAACDRNVEPYVPGEEPRPPDLSKIFPAGAERAAQVTGPPEIPDAEPPIAPGARVADASGPPIQGVVRVAPELAARVPGGGVLFVIARSGAGGPPLAVIRVSDPTFPLPFEIGPENRMIQTLPFAGELRLSARLDQDGDAASRTPGDLQGAADGVHAPGATGVTVTLSELL